MASRGYLDVDSFLAVVERTPLVSIDLIVRSADGEVLLGLRANEPARGSWFVPGGRVRKDERLEEAFARIVRTELDRQAAITDASFRGVYEHLYDTNCAERPGFGTHYVVLAHELAVPDVDLPPPDDQHRTYRWWAIDALLADPQVHRYTKDYFRERLD
jgi:colanic acid biosynthesis protein WcaH